MHNRNRHSQQLAESQSPHWFPDLWREAIVMGKVRWKLLILPVLRKIVNQKQYDMLGVISQSSATIKDLKDAGVGVLTTSLFNLSIWHVQKTGGSWRMTANNTVSLTKWWLQLQLLNQTCCHCLSKLTHPLLPRMGYWSGRCPLSIPVHWHTRITLLSASKARSTPSLPYLRGLSTPQPHVII